MTAVGEPIELPGGARALFTDRSQGNLSSVGGEGCEGGLRARERLRQGLALRALVRGYQVHGTTVARVYADGSRRVPPARASVSKSVSMGEHDARAPDDDLVESSPRADGHAVAARGVGAMALVADCLPVALAADGAVAALHVGWRGLAAGVLERGLRALREVGGSGSVAALLGPCAGGCCYEVGESVHQAFGNSHRHGRLLDLRAIARERLLAAGASDVVELPGCTICDERWFSHRREGDRAGRQAVVAWLPV